MATAKSGEGALGVLHDLSLGALYALFLWAPLASGAYRGWSLAITQLLTLFGLFLWVLKMLAERRLEWRRTALDLPLALLIALVLVQLAVGNRPLADWAMAPPAANPHLPVELPAPFFALGTVSPAQTAQSLLLLLTYAGVYVLVVNLIRERHELDRLVRTLILLGGVLAFLGLLDYLTGKAGFIWTGKAGFIWWRDSPIVARRVFGTFANATHFGAWLAMLVCLGLGYLLARRRSKREGLSFGALLGEEAVRRYFPFVGVIVMALALVFTMSRGGVLSLLLTLVVLLALMGALGLTRWSLVVAGVLLTVMLGAGAWIGLEPFLVRVRRAQPDYAFRWIQSVTTLPMLTAFPLLGVGLGAYKDIYFRYQPAALSPGEFYYPYAHNDLLQFVVEMGPLGAALGLFAVWRVGRDLLAAHLLGQARCPVGGGGNASPQRNDPFSVGIALGALGGVLALFIHSGFDFGARIPANGVLAAACLGLATVALHTRFTPGGERFLTAVRACSLGTGRLLPMTAGATALVLSLALVPLVVRPALVEAKLEVVKGPAARARVEEALAIDPRKVRALEARARLKLDTAREAWNSGLAPGAWTLVSQEERRREALALLTGAIQDLRTALSLTPSDPFLHERLAWAYGSLAALDASSSRDHLASALTHLHRAVALAPENPFLYRSLAALAVTQREPLIEIGLSAARNAVQRSAERAAVERSLHLLPDLVDRFLPLRLSDTQWVALVPDSAIDRLELAVLLERRELLSEAGQVYGRAVELAPTKEASFFRWMHARLLMRAGDHQRATVELDAALRNDPENPELHLARAQALAARGDPAALDAHIAAVLTADARSRQPAQDPLPFQIKAFRARVLAFERLNPSERIRALGYRRALAQYLTERKLWDQALREWKTLLAETPMDALAHFSMGVALDGLGARDQALEAYRKAVSLDARSVRFRLQLAQSLWETGRHFQAIEEWLAITTEQRGNVEAHLALARAYLRIGAKTEAFREYERILQVAPDHPEARQGLARLRANPGG